MSSRSITFANRLSRHSWPMMMVCSSLCTLSFSAILAQTNSVTDNPDIVVTTLAPAVGKITLTEAITQAAADPRDNRMTFDAALADGLQETRFTLRSPWVVTSRSGSDTLDGSALGGRGILDCTSCDDAGIVVSGGRIRFSHLKIIGGRQRAILIRQDGKLELEHVTVGGSHGPGIAMFNEGRLTATSCRIVGNATHGLELHGTSTAEATHTEFIGNDQSAVGVFNQASLIAAQCTMRDNGQWNLVSAGTSQSRLKDCLFSEGRFANIDASESARLELTGCTIEKGKRFGLFATGSSIVRFDRTAIRSLHNRGIEMQDSAQLNMRSSSIENSGDYGMILFGRSACQLEDTSVVGSGAHGVSLRESACGTFVRCNFQRNRYSGIGCLDASDGGKMRLQQCTFTGNGMRPIYRGPLHLDPLPPTPLRIREHLVECLSEPDAEIELYLDRLGEASQYLRTLRADQAGRFKVSCQGLPTGMVITATTTTRENTSEMNVIAGSPSLPILAALLGKTGPCSDDGGEVQSTALLRRWANRTDLLFNLSDVPSQAVERYTRFAIQHIPDWTTGKITARLHVGTAPANVPAGTQVIPVEYLDGNSPHLLGRGGVTLMRWDAQGAFQNPMRIILATATEKNQTCPRVLMHEMGHTLGLCHARVGLLSRMQGMTPPTGDFINDFSPILTYYDVLALHMLYSEPSDHGIRLVELADRGLPPLDTSRMTVQTTNIALSQSDQSAAPLPRDTTNP